MRQNTALDIAVFQDFDAVHACLPVPAAHGDDEESRGESGTAGDSGGTGHASQWLPDQPHFNRME
jgi:hypothetical protein